MSELDGRLSRALASLERTTASPGFTRRVMDAIDSPRGRRRRTGLRWAVAAATLAVALAAGWWRFGPETSPSAADLSRRAEDLRAQHRLLETELAALGREADESLAVLELASGDDLDLVLDLRPSALAREPRDGYPAAPVAAAERR